MGVATAVVAGTALVGAGMSVAQAVKQNKLQKQAARDAKVAQANARNIAEQNPYKGVQVPTIANKQAMEEINQAGANAVNALQGAGAEGVLGGVSDINRGVQGAQLDVAANQNNMQYQRDMAQAEGQLGINARKSERDYEIESAAFMQANQNRSDAQLNKNQAIQNAFSSINQGVGAMANTDIGVYGTKGMKSQSTQPTFDPNNMTPEQKKLLEWYKNNPNSFKGF